MNCKAQKSRLKKKLEKKIKGKQTTIKQQERKNIDQRTENKSLKKFQDQKARF